MKLVTGKINKDDTRHKDAPPGYLPMANKLVRKMYSHNYPNKDL